MKLSRFKLASIGILLLIAACDGEGGGAEYRKLEKDVKEAYGIRIDKDIENLILINDAGCSNCVASFSNYVLRNIDKYKENSIIIINSKGHNVDIDRFNAANMKNIVFLDKSIPECEIAPSLGIIYMKNKAIDTLISIDSDEIKSQIQYMGVRK